jgi:hypothetical protein
MLAGLRPRTAAWLAIALGGIAWAAGGGSFAGERAACPGPQSVLVAAVALVASATGCAGLLLAVGAYRATASERSGDWLLAAAGLYVSALAAISAVAGTVTLLAVDLCEL